MQEQAEFRAHTTDRLTTIETKLSSIETALVGFRLSQAAINPADKRSQTEAKQLIASAHGSSIELPSSVVEQAGKSFVAVASKEPSAWDVALQFLNYRSYLNSVSEPKGETRPIPDFWSKYEIPKANIDFALGTLKWQGFSRPPDVPQLRLLSAPDLNILQPSGPQFLVVTNPSVVLDNLYARRVIFKDSVITYNGGPLKLDEVYFVNCTFQVIGKPQDSFSRMPFCPTQQ